MENLDNIKLGALLSVLGIAFGWLLNQLSQWWRFRKEDKRILKQVLYNLLEIHHLLGRFDIEEPATLLMAKLFEQLPPDQNTEENKIQISGLLLQNIILYFDKTTIVELKSFEEKYQYCIIELSKIDPIRAYYLSDKTKIFDKIKLIEGWVDNVYERHPADPIMHETVKSEMMRILRPDVMASSLKDLKSEMISISWMIHPIMWMRIKKMLNKKNYDISDEWERKTNEIIESILNQIRSQSESGNNSY
jgi:hypothetical protein